MKMLLLGADGQLGFALYQSLSTLGPLAAATRRGVLPGGIECRRADLSDPDALRALIRAERPDWLINAAAYTAVDRAESEPTLAGQINGQALTAIGESAREVGARVLHFSTDYVFSGQSLTPWRETDAPAPINAYGHSKWLGERLLAATGVDHLLLRIAWVYGPRGQNFLRSMLRLAGEREQLRVVADQIGTPTPAALVAGVSAILLQQLAAADAGDPRFGCYHLTAAGATSWHAFAGEILRLAATAGLIARAPELQAIASSEFPTPARRPAYSVLDTGKLRGTFGIELPDWRQGLVQTISALADARAQSLPVCSVGDRP
ncbi:MAG: dTDP-4-dehydrorhamnose reductase [Lysobacterales bacterium]